MSVNHDILKDKIIAAVDNAHGFLPFEQFMQMALFEPTLGYYESRHVFGESGDFITGIDLGPWLGLGFADLMHWGWQQLGKPDAWVLLEQGGGSGHLLTQVLHHLKALNIVMPQVIAVERSAWMRERQAEHYQQQGVDVTLYASLNDVDVDVPVLMMCNELADAFPVRPFVYRDGQCFERGVGYEHGQFIWQEAKVAMADDALPVDADIQAKWYDGYISEYNPALTDWQKDVSRVIQQGFLCCVDYGYSQQEYYRSNRIEGTLMGHCAHQVVEDVLTMDVGSCDITAHIDFTHLARLGLKNDLNPVSFITQGAWLAQSPSVQALIQSLAQEATVEAMQSMAQAKRMLLPMGMGESFKLLIQGKNITNCPDYLRPLDRKDDLHLQ
ncbi:MAG: SAM-dependent methyltransferase [Mariprofundaceae bacterium]|nr:SAM-dependent methyltransferase [Mariprofundaceae bacterium]